MSRPQVDVEHPPGANRGQRDHFSTMSAAELRIAWRNERGSEFCGDQELAVIEWYGKRAAARERSRNPYPPPSF